MIPLYNLDDEISNMDSDTDLPELDKVKFSKLKNLKKRKMIIKFKSVEGADGYEIRYSTKSNMMSARARTTKKTSYTVSSLKKKKYYVRVRAYYYGEDEEKVYGAWSAKKSIKIKK